MTKNSRCPAKICTSTRFGLFKATLIQAIENYLSTKITQQKQLHGRETNHSDQTLLSLGKATNQLESIPAWSGLVEVCVLVSTPQGRRAWIRDKKLIGPKWILKITKWRQLSRCAAAWPSPRIKSPSMSTKKFLVLYLSLSSRVLLYQTTTTIKKVSI